MKQEILSMVSIWFYVFLQQTSAATDYSFRRRQQESVTYKVFSGDGSTQQGWPDVSTWLSFDHLWDMNLHVLNSSCAPTYGDNNSPEEIDNIKALLPKAANYAGVPSELIFVMMMQESDGCVRVGSTANAVTNPGIMQSNNGTGNCINMSPCPAEKIEQMLMDGAGKDREFGLKQALSLFENVVKPAKFYRAARAYNAGELGVVAEHLEQGGATRCYASDIANRLLGWTWRAESACTFDDSSAAPAQVPSTMYSSTVSAGLPVIGTITSLQNVDIAPSMTPNPRNSTCNLVGRTVDLPANCTTYHSVTRGDTCNKIATTYDTTLDQLRELNPYLDAECTNLWLGYCYCIHR